MAVIGGEEVPRGAWPSVVWLDGCTAVFVNRRIVVFAEHCGPENQHVFLGSSFGAESELGPSLNVVACRSHREADPEAGFDVSFCEVEEHDFELTPVPIVDQCERDGIPVEAAVTIVGVGLDGPQGSAGAKRAAQTEIKSVGRTLIIGDGQTGTCRGDSGGPAFVNLSGSTDRPDWRLLAVLSEGKVGECGGGWYTDLTKVVGWLERATGSDLTPCSDDEGQWMPSERCISPNIDSEGLPMPGGVTYASTCGPPYQPPHGGAADGGCQLVQPVAPNRGGALLPAIFTLGLLWCRLGRRRHRNQLACLGHLRGPPQNR